MKLKKSLSAILILIFMLLVSTPVSAKTRITYSNYLKVKMGMKYSSVVKILGKGEKISSTTTGGITVSTYTWKADYNSLNLTIQSGKVVGKSEAGLYGGHFNISKAKYNKLKIGMSLSKVKSILGNGELTMQDSIGEFKTATYTWISSDYANIMCTFNGNSLASKSQYNLR